MGTSFLTGLSTDVKPYSDGIIIEGIGNTRYPLVNSRNYNRKIIRAGNTVTSQKLGIDYPTVAPTGSGGTGTAFYYCYVYVNKTFTDPLALETDNYIRSNSSPVSAAIASASGAPTILGTASADTQVTHVWLYVCATSTGIFVRLTTNYEVANTGTPTWTGPTSVPTTGFYLELDNYPLDTCRIVTESNGFFNYAGFVPKTGTADATVGSATITAAGTTVFEDGIIFLNFQFLSDTTGGPNNNGIHLAKFATAATITLVDSTGTSRNYDGPSNQTAGSFRIWRSGSVGQISKRWNPDFSPLAYDPDFLVRGQGDITGIAKPTTGHLLRYHYNSNGRKSVEIFDFSQGVPPRRMQASSAYAMCCPRAYVAAGNRMFYFDKDAGVIEDKGLNHTPMTLPVIPNLVRSFGNTTASIAEMEYDETRNLIFLSICPSGYSKGYSMLVYNLTTDTWNLWFMVPDVLSMRKVKDPVTGIVTIYMGSSKGSITKWPSANFNEAVGTSQFGSVASTDDSTHLTAVGTPFPVTGDYLIDRWVMVWDDTASIPAYQFARISTNTSSRLTLDTFIGAVSTTELSPVPQTGWAYWVGPIQSILGPCWDYNAVPDTDGHVLDLSMTTSGLGAQQNSRVEVYRNFETTASFGASMAHSLYQDGTPDPDHQHYKLGMVNSVEATGVTGWKITDNNEAAFSLKSLVKRVRSIVAEQGQPTTRNR